MASDFLCTQKRYAIIIVIEIKGEYLWLEK